MAPKPECVYFLDVDNTLLDNDALTQELMQHLADEFGPAHRDRYRAIFEELRTELGYADYLGALQRYRLSEPSNTRLLLIGSFLIDYPFRSRLYPDALAVLRHLRRFGPCVLLSDGDVVFQPRKIQRSGLWEAVDGHVLIYIHKEQMLDEALALYPASHYVMVDDKLRILTAMKSHMGERLTTVFPQQGHYANDPVELAKYPAADLSIPHIGVLLNTDMGSLVVPQGNDSPVDSS
ncbi:MAG: HAD family hydrolase [Burkholderiaceae bacterium]|jgi:FMN phosphatase YigB (HAD superfamily)